MSRWRSQGQSRHLVQKVTRWPTNVPQYCSRAPRQACLGQQATQASFRAVWCKKNRQQRSLRFDIRTRRSQQPQSP